jgi:hypothetical protein
MVEAVTILKKKFFQNFSFGKAVLNFQNPKVNSLVSLREEVKN